MTKFKKALMVMALCVAIPAASYASVSKGDLQRLQGLILNITTATVTTLTATTANITTFVFGGTTVTATGAEINYSDITTLGTLAASKTWSSDASLDTIMPTGGLLTVQSGGQITMNSGSTLAVSGTFSGVALTLTGDLSGDGGDQFFGFLQDQVASTTVAITAAQAGKTFVSNSADVMTLPEASTVLGARYTFVCGTADDFDINPADGTDVIGTVASITGTNTTTVLAPSAGDAIRCTDIGSSITLEAVAADLWISVGNANGIWTDVN